MAVEVASAYVTLMPSMKGFQRRMEREMKGIDPGGGEAGAKFGDSFIGRAGSKIATWGKRGLIGAGATIGAGFGLAITKGLNRMMTIEDAENKLMGLGHSTENVALIMDNALDAVRGTAFGLGDAATLAATAVAAGVAEGEDLVNYLTLAGDAATIANVPLDEMGSIFGKVQTNQRAYTQELNQLADRGIPIYQWLQDEYGVTAEELRKMVSAGEVDAETYFKVIEENIGGAALTAGDTTRGALANLGAAWGRLGAEVLEEVFPLFKDGLSWATDWADSMTEKVGPAVDTVAGYVKTFVQEFKDGEGVGGQFRDAYEGVAEVVQDVGGFIRDDLWPVLKDVGQWMADHPAVVAGVVGAYVGLRLAMDAHAAAMAITKAGGFVAWLTTYASQIKIVAGAKAAWAAITWVVSGAMSALSAVMTFLAANPIALIIIGIAALVAGFIYLWKTNEDFRNFFIDAWDRIKGALVSAWEDYIKPVFTALWSWITDTLIPAFVSFYEDVIVPVWEGIWGAIKAAWDFIYPIFVEVYGFIVDVLIATFQIFAKTVEIVFKLIWAAIKLAWEHYIKPVFEAIWTWIKDTLIPWFEMLWGKVQDVWSWIGNKITDAYRAYVEPIFSAIWNWIKDTLIPWFESLWGKVRDVWDWIGDKITVVWERWISPAFDAMKRAVDSVKEAFERAKEGIGAAWDKVKQVVATPIVAVIDFVNDGIIKGVNTILEWAGVSTISPIKAPDSLIQAARGYTNYTAAQNTYGNSYGPGLGGYADGGVLPGYSPGYDNMRFAGPHGSLELSGGESIMRPEWTKVVGSDFVNSMNAAARNGGISGVQKALGFANGGIMPHGEGDSFASGIFDFFMKPVDWLKGKFSAGLDRLRDNPLFAFAEGTISKIVSGIKDKIFNLIGFGSDASADGRARLAGHGMPWKAIWGLVKARAPEAVMTSNYRPGARTAGYGNVSLHGLGRAIDIISGNMNATYAKVIGLMPWTEALYSPAGNRQMRMGQFYRETNPRTIADHWDHIHLAMNKGGIVPTLYDRGGWLQPGVSLVANQTGKPEAVFTDEQLQRMGGDTNVTLYGVPMDTAAQTADEVLYQMRRVSRGKYAARRR